MAKKKDLRYGRKVVKMTKPYMGHIAVTASFMPDPARAYRCAKLYLGRHGRVMEEREQGRRTERWVNKHFPPD